MQSMDWWPHGIVHHHKMLAGGQCSARCPLSHVWSLTLTAPSNPTDLNIVLPNPLASPLGLWRGQHLIKNAQTRMPTPGAA